MNRETARQLYVMIDAGLIWYKHYYFWCDAIIEKFAEPPIWIIELSTVKSVETAKGIVYEYAYAFEGDLHESDIDRYNKYFLACLYLRYEKNEISWATCLETFGHYSDAYPCGVECEYFFGMLRDYENSLYLKLMEKEQAKKVREFVSDSIENLSELYGEFQDCFIRYVAKNPN